MAWYFEKISDKGRDEKYSYGYKRFSLLGAMINALVLCGGSIFILTEAIPRIMNPEAPNTSGMIGLAILGIVVNGAAVVQLKKGKSINSQVISLHLIEDVLGWVAVLAGALIMHFFDLPVIDPILSIGIAVYIIYNAFKNLKNTLEIILQGIPHNANYQKILEYFNQRKDIINAHDLHVWSLDGRYNILTVHLVVEDETDLIGQSHIKTKIRADLEDMHINHATIEFESKNHQCAFQDC
jgi:cobalt-zinc-cadmium efflux system protein